MKTICVPISAEAESRLDIGEERFDDLAEITLSKADFDLLFSSGWVSAVNTSLHVNIDDFEDEHILDPSSIQKLTAISEQFATKLNKKIFRKISNLAHEALGYGTGIHFYF